MFVAAFAPANHHDTVRGVIVVLAAASVGAFMVAAALPRLLGAMAHRRGTALSTEDKSKLARLTRPWGLLAKAGLAAVVILAVVHALT